MRKNKKRRSQSGKKFLILSIFVTILGLTLAILVVQKNQELRSRASGTSDLLSRKDLIYGSEIGAWQTDGKPAVDTNTPISQKVIDAGIPVIRFALYDCFTDQFCGRDNHRGTQSKANFLNAISGIGNNLKAVLWFKLLPITKDDVGGVGAAGVGSLFCPPWTGPADQNLSLYKSQLDEIRKVYSGPIILESNNEMEYTCWRQWQLDGAPLTGGGNVGVSKRIGEHFAQNMPQLKAYARSLGFSEVITVGYIGVAGGTNWGQSCTPDSTKPYGYNCTYLPRWINEFNQAVKDAYDAAGSNNPDYIPDVESIHAYPHYSDFGTGPSYEFDDKIAYSFYRNWIVQSRARVSAIWGSAIGDKIRFSMSEWNAGVSNSEATWSGWTTPGRPEAFYTGWYNMLQGDGNTTGTGTRFWSANVFLLASNSDTGTGRYYNIIRKDGTTPVWYDTFKNISLGDPLRTSPTPTTVAPTPTPVSSDTIPPTVSITAPANGSIVPRGRNIVISANATDNVGVSKVEFYVNNVLKHTDTVVPYSYLWHVPSKRNITYVLKLIAYDSRNNSSTSTVTVNSR